MGDWETLPGETPIDDISGLKIKGLRTRAELNEAEGENIRRAINKYLSTRPDKRKAPFDYAWALQLHREMFGRVWKWAGGLRVKDVNIGMSYRHVESALFSLLKDVHAWPNSDLLQESAMLHYRAVHIHPFLNGNGRWSRMLANIWLKQHEHAITIWPEELMGAESAIRSEYISAIQEADNGEYADLIELTKRFTVCADN